ncbi:hypothetical protein ACU5P1_15095 [Pseudomonas plecoglossicida]|uniref:Uncharacterized protein n=1 Tax=Pseudomonas plecoglossicida TaxID=70775 RepID=A0AAD0VRN3_PSEDL|nr:hypothetical protein [Pseudomonas plecoglossicida]AXM95279.1 hypothetical protein DVB73_05390 [Pseudomonas plecoglossicida]EPB97511.1 hypothetical protein L321_02487 [Pseudomonas plecoglossicida NB2011]QLB56028.1 hypothetical protein HAV28_14930 [Pseudomonas plecoglossicida]GLR37465.1 hypothetical protein GCM10011247_28620 [Pseudomonas plecoglossicida]
MPIAPLPRTFFCPHCGWQRTTIPASDALRVDIDWFFRCPTCQSELQIRPATRAEIMKVRLAQFFRHPGL